MDPIVVVGALATVITSMAGFIVWLFKQALADKAKAYDAREKEFDEQMAETRAQYEARLEQERGYTAAVVAQRDRLFNLVVKTQDVAKQAIEHLPTAGTRDDSGKRG